MSGTYEDKSSDEVDSRFWVPVTVGRFKTEEDEEEEDIEEEEEEEKRPKKLEKRESDQNGNDNPSSAWLPPNVETMNLVELPILSEGEVFVFNPKQTGKANFLFCGKTAFRYIRIFQVFTESTTTCPPGAV